MRNKVVADSGFVFSPELDAKMKSVNIDPSLTKRTIDAFNAGKYDGYEPIEAKEIPGIDGESVIEIKEGSNIIVGLATAQALFDSKGINIELRDFAEIDEAGNAIFSFDALTKIGNELFPYVGYGMLNGGSASSYVDKKKNSGGYPALYELYRNQIESASTYNEIPKGLTEAYINPDGSKGFDIMEIKIRALLIRALQYMRTHEGTTSQDVVKMFQMDSVLNHEIIQSKLEEYQNSPLLKDLLEALGDVSLKDIFLTGSQPLLAAITAGGRPADVFTTATGKKHGLIPMPRGHGHNFEVLKDVFTSLYKSGVRYYYLGNIDNMANMYDPASVAALAITGKNGAFDFSFKTKADVKGGVLIKDQFGKYNCGDIGVAVKEEKIKELDEKGHPILFNCATGVFDLEWIITNIDNIADNLPMRVSVQKKDAGTYVQAEQVTWEVIGMMANPMFIAVNKDARFLAAKMYTELLMTSGIGLDNANYPEEYRELATQLNQGLHSVLVKDYGMMLKDGKWQPLSIENLLPED